MPLKLNFKRTHRYDVSSRGLFVIPIYTLNNVALEFTVSGSNTGRDALEFVAQRLEIDDISYFGFRYESWDGEYRWLFLNKSVKKQLDKHARQHSLVFGVMFFIENPQFIPRDVIRRQFFYQLRHEVASGKIILTPKQAIKLGAYCLQAENGDFIDCESTIDRWRERPPIHQSCLQGGNDLETADHAEDILWGYRHLQGVSQVNAQWYYIDEVRRRNNYGVELFKGSTRKNVLSELGVSRNGIVISDIIDSVSGQKHNLVNLRWEEIKDLAYSKKTFSIQRLRKSKPINFCLPDKDKARYLWQYCIQIHGFYINYWTRFRTSPPQPVVHVPEPPDIIRGMSNILLSPRANSSRSYTSDGSTSGGGSQGSFPHFNRITGLPPPAPKDSSTSTGTDGNSLSIGQEITGRLANQKPPSMAQLPLNDTDSSVLQSSQGRSSNWISSTSNLLRHHGQHHQLQQLPFDVRGDVSSDWLSSHNTVASSRAIPGDLDILNNSGGSNALHMIPPSHLQHPRAVTPPTSTSDQEFLAHLAQRLFPPSTTTSSSTPPPSTFFSQPVSSQPSQVNVNVSSNTSYNPSTSAAPTNRSLDLSPPDAVALSHPTSHSFLSPPSYDPPTHLSLPRDTSSTIRVAPAAPSHNPQTNPPPTTLLSPNCSYSPLYDNLIGYTSSGQSQHATSPGVAKETQTPTATSPMAKMKGDAEGDGRHAKISKDIAANLLSNPDIHQLLSLTNIQETELTHRLLTEYRLTLRQQQSYHTNSVSTPNLAARDIYDISAPAHHPLLPRHHAPARIPPTPSKDRASPDYVNASVVLETARRAAGERGSRSRWGGVGGSSANVLQSDRWGAAGTSCSVDSNATFRVHYQVANHEDPSNMSNGSTTTSSMLDSATSPPPSLLTSSITAPEPRRHPMEPRSTVGRVGTLPISRSEQGPRWTGVPLSPDSSFQLSDVLRQGYESRDDTSFSMDGRSGTDGGEENEEDDMDDDDEDDGSLHEYILQQPEEMNNIAALHMSTLLSRHTKSSSSAATCPPSNQSVITNSSVTSSSTVATVRMKQPAPPPPSTSHNQSSDRSMKSDESNISSRPMRSEEAPSRPIKRRSEISHRGPSLSLMELLRRPETASRRERPVDGRGSRERRDPSKSTSPGASIKDEKRIELAASLSDIDHLSTEFTSLPLRSSTVTSYVGASDENRSRNRSTSMVPYDQTRVKLTPTSENSAGYINASHIKVDLEKCGRRLHLWLIATQLPLANTVADFWVMVWEANISVLGLLASDKDSQTYHYMPNEKTPVLNLRNLTIRFQWRKPGTHYEQTCIEIEHRNRIQSRRAVYHFRFSNWTENDVPANVAQFTEYLDELTTLNRHLQSPVKSPSPSHDPSAPPLPPIVFLCESGAGSCGIAVLYLVTRLVLEHNLVHSGLRLAHLLASLRSTSCPGLVHNMSQFVFVHRALLHFLNKTRLI